jgi:hypothetical protein
MAHFVKLSVLDPGHDDHGKYRPTENIIPS